MYFTNFVHALLAVHEARFCSRTVRDFCDSVMQRIHVLYTLASYILTLRWLQRTLPQLCIQMEAVRRQLALLRNISLWWMDRLIRVGLQVLS